MADQRAQYTEEAVGAGHPTKTDVINRMMLVEHDNDGTHQRTGGVTGSKLWWYQNTAPLGWTIDSVPADAVLAVKGGANAYNANGGTQVGAWTQPNHTHTGPSHTHTGPSHQHTGPSHQHTTPGHTLTIAEMPEHDHDVSIYDSGANNSRVSWEGDPTQGEVSDVTSIIAKGGGGSHAHGNTGAGGTGNTGASGTGATGAGGIGATGGGATAATYRPLAQIGIIATKD